MSQINPLQPIHEAHDAEMQPYADVQIVSTYGHPQAEYAAIRNRCALMDLSQRSILELTGRDRLAFLSNLVTNRTWDKQTRSGLGAGEGTYAFFINNKGRIITDVTILERGDRTFLELERRKVEELRGILDKYLFAEQVKIMPRTDELHELALLGPKAPALLQELTGKDVSTMAPLASIEASILGRTVTVWRDDVTATPGFGLIVASDQVAALWTALLEKYGQEIEPGRRALRPVGWAAFNAARIEAGRPIFGIDFDETVLPIETGLFDRGVSITKGCYLGQEIVARMHARQQVPRQVVGIRMDDDALPIAGAPVMDANQNVVGGITSSTMSPVLSDTAICLAMLKKGHFAPGTRLNIPAEGKMRVGAVTALPFIKTGGTSGVELD